MNRMPLAVAIYATHLAGDATSSPATGGLKSSGILVLPILKEGRISPRYVLICSDLQETTVRCMHDAAVDNSVFQSPPAYRGIFLY